MGSFWNNVADHLTGRPHTHHGSLDHTHPDTNTGLKAGKRSELAPQITVANPGLGIKCTTHMRSTEKYNDWGVELTSVEPGSLAARYGLRKGDVITKISRNGKAAGTMTAPSNLAKLLNGTGPDDKLHITFTRNGKSQSVDLTGYHPRGYLGVSVSWVGAGVDYAGQKFYGNAPAISSFRASSPAKKAGLHGGDIILGARSGKRFVNFADPNVSFSDYLASCPPGYKTFLIQRWGHSRPEEVKILLSKPVAAGDLTNQISLF